MRKSKINVSSLETREASTLTIVIFYLYQKIAMSARNIHIKLLPDKTEIRDENKNILFCSKNKRLVKTLFNFAKIALSFRIEERVRFIIDIVVPGIPLEAHKSMLEQLVKHIEGEHPRPWRLGAHHDRIIDALG